MSILSSPKVVLITKATCVAKVKGGRYEAEIISSSASPYGKTKRIKWTQEEKDAIYSVFGDPKKLERLPTLMQCCDAIKSETALKRRKPQQIKSWIDNQRRYK